MKPPSPAPRTSTADSSRLGERQQQLPPMASPVLSQKLPQLPPPPIPYVKPPSPFHPNNSTGIRPVFSSAPSVVPPTSMSSPAPPSVFSTSSYPFFPPLSMARPASNHSSHSTTSSGFPTPFLAPSPPTVAAPPTQPKHTSLGAPTVPLGDPSFSLARLPFSTASFAPISSAKPVTSAAETAPVSSRPSSRTSSSLFNHELNRTGSLPFPGHSSSTRSPSLPPPLTPSTFPIPGKRSLTECFLIRC